MDSSLIHAAELPSYVPWHTQVTVTNEIAFPPPPPPPSSPGSDDEEDEESLLDRVGVLSYAADAPWCSSVSSECSYATHRPKTSTGKNTAPSSAARLAGSC